MSKKNIVLILLLTCFLTIMAISIWGKQAEIPQTVLATSVTIYDNTGSEVTNTVELSSTSDPDVKIQAKQIKLDKDSSIDTYIYYFAIKVNPDNTTDTKVISHVTKGSSYATLNEQNYASWKFSSKLDLDDSENMHFYSITFTKQDTCRLSFEYNTDKTPATETLSIIWEGTDSGGTIII